MNPKNDRTQPVESRPALPPTPRNRFRIEKLEERIAPRGRGAGGPGCHPTTMGHFHC